MTVVINRRRKIFAFEGVGVAATASDIRAKLAVATVLANSQLPGNSIISCAVHRHDWSRDLPVELTAMIKIKFF
jgi:hypothetical protein